jgi:hypothetical protein
VVTHRPKWAPPVIDLLDLIEPGNRGCRHVLLPPCQRAFGSSLPTFERRSPPRAANRIASVRG